LGLDFFVAAMWGVQPWFCLTAETVHLAVWGISAIARG